jgi:hypothetical protein
MKPLTASVCISLALLIGAAFGRWTTTLQPPPTVAAVPEARPAATGGFLQKRPAATEGVAESQQTTVRGVVREVIQVPNYTYLRLTTAEKTEAWVAVESNASLAVDAPVVVSSATLMQNFASKTLNRTFAEIYFGRISAPD